MRLAMKTLNRAMASALLLSGFVLCNFGAQADVSYSKVGEWLVAYLEVGNLNGCRAAKQFPDQTVFQMASRSKAEPTKLGQLGLRSFVNFLGSLSFDRQF